MSRRAQKLIMLLCSAVIASVIYLDHKLHRDTREPADSNQAITAPAASDDFSKYHNKTFTVVKVVDGDTLDLNIPDGKYKTTRIRLLGVDTPETKKPNTPVMYFGPEAYEFTKQTVLGGEVTIILDQVSPARDRYGRLLAYIKLSDDRMLNESLISDGYAYADSRFRHSFYKTYMQLQAKARRLKKGLWKEITPDQMPPWMQKKEAQGSKKAA
jgi:micrococcal nuclease